MSQIAKGANYTVADYRKEVLASIAGGGIEPYKKPIQEGEFPEYTSLFKAVLAEVQLREMLSANPPFLNSKLQAEAAGALKYFEESPISQNQERVTSLANSFVAMQDLKAILLDSPTFLNSKLRKEAERALKAFQQNPNNTLAQNTILNYAAEYRDAANREPPASKTARTNARNNFEQINTILSKKPVISPAVKKDINAALKAFQQNPNDQAAQNAVNERLQILQRDKPKAPTEAEAVNLYNAINNVFLENKFEDGKSQAVAWEALQAFNEDRGSEENKARLAFVAAGLGWLCSGGYHHF